jgi:hypothetical protein
MGRRFALNERHEFGRAGGHHSWQCPAGLCGHSRRPQFFLGGRQARTAAAAQQRAHCRARQSAHGQVQREDQERPAEVMLGWVRMVES